MTRLKRAVPAMALIGALSLGATAAQAALPGGNGRIHYTQDRAGKGRLYAIDQGGRSSIRVGKIDPYDASQSAVSPDGTTIVFQSYRNGNSELYLTAVDGRGPVTRLTKTQATEELLPTWSPNGKKILFQAGPRGSAERDLYTINARGRDKHR